jgi:hypothetical protein
VKDEGETKKNSKTTNEKRDEAWREEKEKERTMIIRK